MKEDYLNRMAKKIRNQLIYYIHTEIKNKSKKNHHLLINSMSPKEINSKYQNCSDYCIEKIETYSSSQINNGVHNNNYFYVSLTYCSANNNYHMLIDNKNTAQMIGENNIIGKYYKGNSVSIRITTNKENYNINGNEIELKKMIIGDKKFEQKKRIICSSLDISKNMILNYNENNFNNKFMNNINSIHNNYNKIINIHTNNEINKINRTKKTKIQNIINIYTRKLKNYCSSLIILKKKKEINNIQKIKNPKNLELVSPAISEHKKNFKKERNYFLKNEKEKPKLHNIYTNRENHNLRYQTESHSKIQNIHSKLKSQTKISFHLFKIPEKKSFHKKNKAQSIDIDISDEKNATPKKSSPKKILHKKNMSPKKLIHSIKPNNDLFISNTKQKHHRKTKTTESNIKKFISGGILNKRKLFNANNVNVNLNVNVNYKYTNNVASVLNSFKVNSGNKKFDRKYFKRANTGISNKYHFRGSDIKLKENNI